VRPMRQSITASEDKGKGKSTVGQPAE
jgi:hypothetical protein